MPLKKLPSIDYVFLDSGTGGIPYLVHLMEKSPYSKCLYIADNENFPYGEKTHEQIVSFGLKIVRNVLKKYNPKVFVIACNTMSVNSLDILREAFPDKKFVGTVPAIKTAGELSVKRCIGLLATSSTVKSQYNQDLKNHFAADCKLVLRADPELISFIEHEGFFASDEKIQKKCKGAIDFFKENGCDVIVLGCTHFLNISSQMQQAAGSSIKIIDSREGVVNRALSLGGKRNAVFKKRKPFLYVTACDSDKNREEYDIICKKYDFEFAGILGD